MYRSWPLLVLLGVLAWHPAAHGNGRFPATRGVAASGDRWVVPVTFGMLVSNDGGATFYWLCEDALGYGGTYDPYHLIDGQGDRWITSFDGIRVSRDDGCTWDPVGAPFDELFPGAMTIDASGRLWVVTAQAGAENGVYRNDDPAAGEFLRLQLDTPDGLFTGVAVAPSRAQRAYVSGFVIEKAGSPAPLLFSTDDGGQSWSPLPVDAFDLGDQPSLEARAVDPEDPDVVYLTIARTDGGGDLLYRSSDAGQSFVEVLALDSAVDAVLPRAGGQVIVGAGAQGTWLSTDGGISFEQAEEGLQLGCAAEDGEGSILGCGSNVEPDFAAIATSADGRSWQPVLTLDAIAGPLECEVGTPQRDTCAQLWPGLAEQLGIGEDGGDAGPGGGGSDGCGCRAQPDGGGSNTGALLVLLAALMVAGCRPAWSRSGRRSGGPRRTPDLCRSR